MFTRTHRARSELPLRPSGFRCGSPTAVDFTNLSPWLYPLLFLTGLAAGFVDSIAGGGGLITIPVLLSVGMPPQLALGTNKLQATFGSGSAAWHYAHAGTVDWRDCSRGFLLSAIGAVAGTLTVQQLDPSFLKRAIPVLLGLVALYVLL